MRMTVSLHAHRRHRHRAMTMMTMIRCLFSSPLTPGGVTGTERSRIFFGLVPPLPIDSRRGHRDGALAIFFGLVPPLPIDSGRGHRDGALANFFWARPATTH